METKKITSFLLLTFFIVFLFFINVNNVRHSANAIVECTCRFCLSGQCNNKTYYGTNCPCTNTCNSGNDCQTNTTPPTTSTTKRCCVNLCNSGKCSESCRDISVGSVCPSDQCTSDSGCATTKRCCVDSCNSGKCSESCRDISVGSVCPSDQCTSDSDCVVTKKYKCDIVNNLNQCIEDANGNYTSLASCSTACPNFFSCSKSPLGCYPSSSGYIWKDACENNCYYGFNCYPGYVCSYGFLGNYTSLGSCELCCKNPDPCNTYYSCNPDPNNPRCVVDSGGSYASWSYCADNCGSNGGNPPPTSPPPTSPPPTSPPPTSPPPTIPETEPCIISYLRLPSKAWVNYSITGTWLASDWCNDCDINCSPYPACVWQEEGIGTGPDENSFILEQAGTYYYTLICHGDDDEDSISDSIKVDAFNIPWWQEIIPVLPSFLRGIWK